MESIINKIKDIIIPHQEKLNIELFDIKCIKLKNSWLIRIYIDQEEGVTIDKCEEVSRFIGNRLDSVIEESYRLEISSPGIERPLRDEKDYKKYKNCLAEITTLSSDGLKKTYIGYIDNLKDETLFLLNKENKKLLKIPYQEITKAKLKFEFKR
jgi:ribosome maturation factor RimP